MQEVKQIDLNEAERFLQTIVGKTAVFSVGYAGVLLVSLGQTSEETKVTRSGKKWKYVYGEYSLTIEGEWQIYNRGTLEAHWSQTDPKTLKQLIASFKEVRIDDFSFDKQKGVSKFHLSNNRQIIVKHAGKDDDFIWYVINNRSKEVLSLLGNGTFTLR